MTRSKRSVPATSRTSELFTYDCYLSYSPIDGAEYANKLAGLLAAAGVSCFIDMGASDLGQNQIRKVLQRARSLILIGTPAALKSSWTLFELGFFSEQGRPVIVITLGSDVSREHPLSLVRDYTLFREDPARLKVGPTSLYVQNLAKEIQRSLGKRIYPSAPRAVPRKEEPTEASHPLNEGKLILVGRGEVGKTSIVKRLVHRKFRGDESKTQGINITNWSTCCSAEEVRLNIWDFGGQEIMHATHQFFLTERSLYLLVLNGRGGDEDEDAEYWLKHIETFGGSSPVIVVQNKIEQHPFDLNYRGLKGRYPQIREFVKTDCATSAGLDHLELLIQEALDDMPEIRLQVPLQWIDVKNHLESMKDDFMSYESFRSLCHELGIAQESDRDMLSWVLHCLGIALNYRDDSRLRETSILKPEWVTHGIYQILNADTVNENKGELHLEDLRWLLRPKERYPAEKNFFLLELMRKFSLCFAFPDDHDHYLIPELLGKEEPQAASSFGAHECLGFEYDYEVLPEGLIPRFIVRSHSLSQGQERWRFGAILAHENCKALVKAEPGDRRIIIRVKGGDAGARRRLLAIIRYDFDRIHGEFKDRLEVKARVPLSRYPGYSVEYSKLLAFEGKGVVEFPEFVGQDVVYLKVGELLDGVDFKSRREDSSPILKPRTIFFSYSHRDEGLRDELETHLKLLQRQGVISAWYDRKILPGSEWDDEIDRHLDGASIILLLVSSDFIASHYCWDKEVRRAMERHDASEATVIPVFLRACDWKDVPFGKLQGLPADARPVTAWADRDSAWTEVAKGIRAVAESKE